ncbi:MAG: phenylalanine--tRNA ligase subunit alpha [Chloroflexi bacterium]|nr:phenylalanine--tRNA ligase subunit alpha [Chloroflexota bacterium]
MIEQLKALELESLDKLKAIDSLSDLDQWRVEVLGRKGSLALLLRGMGQLPAADRPAVGARANEVKNTLEAAYALAENGIKQQAIGQRLHQDQVDVTLPGRRPGSGRLHLSTQSLQEIGRIFATMGFQVWESPEVELDLFNFELLNIPPYHPARDMQDTFYTTNSDILLRTHTSPGQIRVMRRYAPEPIRVILPGKCYRFEQVTTRSDIQFYQVEGLAVGRHITLADLKGTIANFAIQMFGPGREVRFRYSYFPFTEPSVEADVDCIICGGKGCRLCKYSGWLEIMGAGMVHPTVLRNGGYDPDIYSGFAFGMGPGRISMLQHAIDDIRYILTSDLRFLEQF